MQVILGLNFGHDGAAALIVDNQLVAAISNERISRQKKASGVTQQMIDYVLQEAGLTVNQITAVAFACYIYNPENVVKITNQKCEEYRGDLVRLLGGTVAQGCHASIQDKTFPAYFIHHHMAHCAAAFFTSPFERAACFSVDASMFHPESCSLFACGDGNKLHYFYCPGVMIGNAYSVFTEMLGLGPGLTKAGTMMGLAPFGKPSDIARSHWRDFSASFYERKFQDSDPVFIGYLWSQLSGLPRQQVFPRELSDSAQAMEIAASIQFVFENALVSFAEKLFQETKNYNDANLCLSGGSFLNADANMQIKQRSSFKNLHLLPACGDDGTAIGSALFVNHTIMGNPRFEYKPSQLMYLGRHYQLPNDIRSRGTPYSPREIAQELNQGKIVAWFQGRSEFGPRALGNRSLLADPRDKNLKEKLNQTIKKREWFRPFAPSVLSEAAADWFDINFESKYMLFLAAIKQPDKIPAVSHIDGTARLQTVTREDNPRYHELISAFAEITGVPLLLNTSLNVNSEPLVETPEDALRFFESTETDLLVLEDIVIKK